METPSPDREKDVTQVGTPITGNETLTNVNTVAHGDLGENNLEDQFTETSQISNEIQVRTQIMEQKNNDRIEKMSEERENKLETILKEIKSNKGASTVTNPKSEINKIRDSQPSGSKTNKSRGVHASNKENSDSDNDDYPLIASKMKDLRHPAKPLFHNETDVDVTILSNEESDVEKEEDYHNVSAAFKIRTDAERNLQNFTA